jgi:hypothetical protein
MAVHLKAHAKSFKFAQIASNAFNLESPGHRLSQTGAKQKVMAQTLNALGRTLALLTGA